MKKYSILLAIAALLVASLACKTVMGGGNSPILPSDNGNGGGNGGGGGIVAPTADTSGNNGGAVPTTDASGGNITVGGSSEFPMPSDATNVISVADPASLTYQTKLSSDDVMKFYRDEFGKQGYTEDSSIFASFGGAFTMGFKGHSSGKEIIVVGGPSGDGTTAVTVTLQ